MVVLNYLLVKFLLRHWMDTYANILVDSANLFYGVYITMQR